ncbi:MAG: ABC transporter substrate-binding protein, partial [Hyphomicrobiaceae bacterium]
MHAFLLAIVALWASQIAPRRPLCRTGSWPALAAVLLVLGGNTALAQTPAEAAPPPYVINLLVSSHPRECTARGYRPAISALAGREVERINREGGIAGRRIEIRLLDDRSEPGGTVSALDQALHNPDSLAIIGLSSSNRADTAFKSLQSEIKSSGIPFISHISVQDVFRNFPNVYSTQASQEVERIPVMAQFIKALGFHRVAFLGTSDSVYSQAIAKGLAETIPASDWLGAYTLKRTGDTFDQQALRTSIEQLQSATPDLLVLGVGGRSASDVLTQIRATGLAPALFVAGSIDRLPERLTSNYPNAIYQLAWDQLPEAYNARVREVLAHGDKQKWAFAGRKNESAEGWITGECKKQDATAADDPLSPANLRAISTGARYADMVALVAAATRSARKNDDIATLRRSVLTS